MILLTKEKIIMSKLKDSVDYNNLKFEYVGPTKDVSFYEFMDSKEHFNKIANNQIRFSEVKNRQNEFSNKLSNIKIGKKKMPNKKKWSIFLINFTILNKNLLMFLKTILKCYLCGLQTKNDETKGTRLKILTPKQMLQRSPIALAQVKAGNNSGSLLNEIRQIVYSLYQSKQITKKVYNNIIKSIQL